MKIQTRLLKGVLVILTIGVLGLAGVVVPVVTRVVSAKIGAWSWLLGAGLYLSLVFVFAAIVESYRLLRAIDAATAFSQPAVNRLRWIKWCAYGVVATLALLSPVVYVWVQAADAPGLLLGNLILLGIAGVIGIFAGVLQRLLASVVVMKHENAMAISLK